MSSKKDELKKKMFFYLKELKGIKPGKFSKIGNELKYGKKEKKKKGDKKEGQNVEKDFSTHEGS